MKNICIVFILLLSLALAPCLFAEGVGKVVSTQGRVDIFREGSQSAVPAVGDDLISVGDSIRTKSGSKAQVLFKDESVLKLAENSKVSIKDYQLDEKQRRTSATIELSRGKARAIIAKTPSGAPFVIKTPNAEGTVRGSDITTFYQAGNSGMFVSEGKLSVVNLAHMKNSIVVPKGSACVIPMDELPKGPRPYLDAEKKLNDEDTYVPVSISKIGKTSIIKGTVARVSGIVSITPKDSTQVRKAGINDILGEGDSIETGENGFIEVRLDNNNAINLKPNTKLKIIKLAINSKTGEFENIFEVTLGKIKARIENLKGNSKFEVKTPQAVCGARGTIMYIMVTQSTATSFFEGGNGYMTNTLSGVNQNVGAGQSSTSDYSGSISIPIYVSDNERQSYSEGWDGSGDHEGYSSPGSGIAGDLMNTGGADNTGQTYDGNLENNFGPYFSEIPFSQFINVVSSLAPATTSITRFEGAGKGTFLHRGGSIDCDSLTGVVISSAGSSDSTWLMEAEGTYNTYSEGHAGVPGASTIFIDDRWTMDFNGRGFASEEGMGPDKFYWAGTTSGNGDKWGSGVVEGAFSGFWLGQGDAPGTIKGGIIDGAILGYYTDADEYSGTWNIVGGGRWHEGSRSLDATSIEILDASIRNLAATSIPITCAYYSINGPGTSGVTQAAMGINLYALSQTAQNGIWAAIINGTYSTAPTSDWSVTLAGATLSGQAWSNGQWAGNVSGTVDDNVINGQASGAYGDGSFRGAGIGTWNQQQQ